MANYKHDKLKMLESYRKSFLYQADISDDEFDQVIFITFHINIKN